jgi:hypothetical protein
MAIEIDSTEEQLLSVVEVGLGVTFVSSWTVRNQLALNTFSGTEVEVSG